VNEARTGFFRN